jgi:hypothetical protein
MRKKELKKDWREPLERKENSNSIISEVLLFLLKWKYKDAKGKFA